MSLKSKLEPKDRFISVTSFWGLSQAIADLLLLHDKSEEWIAEPKVRRAWHLLFLSICFVGVWEFIGLPAFKTLAAENYEKSETIALIVRTFYLASCTFLILLLIRLSYVHFFYLILTGKDLRLKSIAFF